MRLSHSFNVDHAEKYGIECAILIYHFQFWIEQNQSLGKNFHDGKTWSYQTQKEIAAIYPYWSEDTVQRLLKKLIEKEILIKGNYNNSQFDKTQWYAFKDEKMFTKPRNRGIETANSQDPNREVASCIIGKDTNKDTKEKQQQQTMQHNIEYQTKAAAASFEKNNKIENVRIYGNLQKIDIPELDKIEITQKYSEIVVKNAIDWATHPQTKLNKGLAPAIKWACQTKPEVPKNAIDEVQSNKKAATELLKRLKCPQFVRVEILHKKAEIVFENCSKEPICISYTEKGFLPQFESSLRKVGCSLIPT